MEIAIPSRETRLGASQFRETIAASETDRHPRYRTERDLYERLCEQKPSSSIEEKLENGRRKEKRGITRMQRRTYRSAAYLKQKCATLLHVLASMEKIHRD
jgi:hypothetical protein